MSTAAEALINAFLPVAERAVVALERWLDDAEIGIVDDAPEHAVPISRLPDWERELLDPHCTSVTDSEPEPDAVTSTEGLTVAELDALPAWSVVDATGGERWFVKVPDDVYWVAIGGLEAKPAAELIQDEGPILLARSAPGPDDLVIKRPDPWEPGMWRGLAKRFRREYRPRAADLVESVADALEAER